MDLETKMNCEKDIAIKINAGDLKGAMDELFNDFGHEAVQKQLEVYGLVSRDTLLSRFRDMLSPVGERTLPDRAVAREINKLDSSNVPYWSLSPTENRTYPMEEDDITTMFKELSDHAYNQFDIENLKAQISDKMKAHEVKSACDLIIQYFSRDDFLGSLEYFDLNTYDGEISYLQDELEDYVKQGNIMAPHTKRAENIISSIKKMQADPVPYWTRETDTPRPINKDDMFNIIDSLVG